MKTESVDVIPYSATISADLLTPVTAFLRLSKDEAQCFLFESVEGGDQLSRFSFIGIRPIESLFIKDGAFQVRSDSGSVRKAAGNPFHEMGRYLRRFKGKSIEGAPPFTGGAVGYMSYDSVQFLEKVGQNSKRGLSPYDAYLMLFRTVVVFDHVRKELIIVVNSFGKNKSKKKEHELARLEIEEIKFKLGQPSSEEAPLNLSDIPFQEMKVDHLEATLGKAKFMAAVKKIKNHIRAGDIFQCVLSERFSTDLNIHPFLLYRTLRSMSPAPYLFYLRMNEETLLGASPEMLVRVKDKKVESYPIAGTRPRGKTEVEDRKFEVSLLDSTKEKAEHLMLVDLGRNDIGRVSTPGSVSVPKFMKVEKFSHVMHLVSQVEGRLAQRKTAWDALASCFPAGTLTGAPKVRAMQIISELEPDKRGTYGGAVIYHDFSGKLDSCIAIRSIYCAKGKAYLQAGAGIVADSSPEREYNEVLRKTQSVRQALALARAQQTKKNIGGRLQ